MGQNFDCELTGDASLRQRPMQRVATPLGQMRAEIRTAEGGRPPLKLLGIANLRGIEYRLPIASAQVKSALLLAGLYARGRTCVTEPAPTRDHTERALAAFGATLAVGAGRIALGGGQRLTAREVAVPGDFSSAAFWLVAAAALPGSRIEIEEVGLNPTRTALVDVLRRFGAIVRVEVTGEDAGEPRGTIVVPMKDPPSG